MIMYPVDLAPEDRLTVCGVMRQWTSDEVGCMGSRAHWTRGRASDLDVVVRTQKPMSFELRSQLAEAFLESDLSFAVDVMDYAGTTESFRQIIDRSCIMILGEGVAVPQSEADLPTLIELLEGQDKGDVTWKEAWDLLEYREMFYGRKWHRYRDAGKRQVKSRENERELQTLAREGRYLQDLRVLVLSCWLGSGDVE